MKKKKYIILILIVILIFAGFGLTNAAEKVVLKLHHAMPTTHPFIEGALHPYQAGAVKLAELVSEKSNGSMEIVIYPANALGEDEKILELMQEGIVDMSLVMPVAKAAAIIPDMNVFSFPFLFVSSEHGKAFAKSEKGIELLNSAEEYGLVGLGFSTFIFRYPINRIKPLTNVEDFSGLKFRTMGLPAALDTYRYLGTNTVSIPFGELYSSLQLGVIDGVENDLLTILSQNYYEVAEYLTLVPVWPFASITLMSKQNWEKLSTDQQEILRESIPEALKVLDSEYEKGLNTAIDMLKKEGVSVSEPSDVKPFIKAVQPVYDDLLPKLTSEQQEIVQYILELGEDF